VILGDGTVLLPVGLEAAPEIARGLGDDKAAKECERAKETRVVLGERMCG
jgi:hypothetical protein